MASIQVSDEEEGNIMSDDKKPMYKVIPHILSSGDLKGTISISIVDDSGNLVQEPTTFEVEFNLENDIPPKDITVDFHQL